MDGPPTGGPGLGWRQTWGRPAPGEVQASTPGEMPWAWQCGPGLRPGAIRLTDWAAEEKHQRRLMKGEEGRESGVLKARQQQHLREKSGVSGQRC